MLMFAFKALTVCNDLQHFMTKFLLILLLTIDLRSHCSCISQWQVRRQRFMPNLAQKISQVAELSPSLPPSFSFSTLQRCQRKRSIAVYCWFIGWYKPPWFLITSRRKDNGCWWSVNLARHIFLEQVHSLFIWLFQSHLMFFFIIPYEILSLSHLICCCLFHISVLILSALWWSLLYKDYILHTHCRDSVA